MSHSVQTEKPNVSSSSALWAILIFVGLIIAAINFVQAESKGEGHEHGAATEHHDGAAAHGEGHEASGSQEAAAQPEEHETKQGAAATATDSAAHGEHAAPAEKPAHEEAHH